MKKDKKPQPAPKKTLFFAYVPFTGLGLYGGFRGNRWLRNRIKVFKQYVIPSLQNQADQDFTLWLQWRPQERGNSLVMELESWLAENTSLKVVSTFGGLCFWDDKFEDKVAWDRLVTNLQNTMPELFDAVGAYDEVIMLIQPSDDLYEKFAVRRIKDAFASDKALQCVGYQQGFHMNYVNTYLSEYNPNTNPPFFAIRFPKEIFLDPIAHMKWSGPYKSHEYAPSHMKYWRLPGRGFIVGSHTENISTHANHPFVQPFKEEDGDPQDVLSLFGIADAPQLVLPKSWRKDLMRKLPHKWQKVLRFVFGEKIFNRVYQFIRN